MFPDRTDIRLALPSKGRIADDTLSFLSEVHPSLIGLVDFPALGAHVGRLEALPAFEAIRQPFIAPT